MRRFEIITWPSAVPYTSPPWTNPNSYSNDSRFNRLVYQSPASERDINVKVSGASLGQAFVGNRIDINIGLHKARYVMLLNLQDDYFDPTELQVLQTQRSPVRDFVNGNFEQVPANNGNVFMVREGLVEGWSTTEQISVSSQYSNSTVPVEGSLIEFWKSGFNNVDAYEGSYFVELNAFTNGMLEQEPICVLPNESFRWSFAHRGRGGTDVMSLRINDVDVAHFADGNTSGGIHSYNILDATTTIVEQKVTHPTNGWTKYTGTWHNSSNAPIIVSFGFSAVSTGGTNDISIGNFIDDVSLVSLNTLVSGGIGQGPEIVTTANLPKLILKGNLTTASSVQLNIIGGTATKGVDYKTIPETGPITIDIPAGNYDGTATTGLSLAPYIQILTDQESGEPDETIFAELSNPSNLIIIADAKSCTNDDNARKVSYTITDSAPITVDISTTNVTCFNGFNGALLASASGGTGNYSYSWNTTPVQNTNAINNLTAGSYQVTISDVGSGEVITRTAEIVQPPAIVLAETITHVSAYGQTDGAIAVAASGGVGTKTFLWTFPDGSTHTQEDLVNIPAGSYTLTVTDANNCTYTENYTVRQPPIVTLLPTEILCFGATIVNVSFNNPLANPTQYSISWSAQAATAGFASEDNLALPTIVSPATYANLPITIPANLAAGTYYGYVRVKNAIGDESPNINFEITIAPKPNTGHIQLVNP